MQDNTPLKVPNAVKKQKPMVGEDFFFFFHFVLIGTITNCIIYMYVRTKQVPALPTNIHHPTFSDELECL